MFMLSSRIQSDHQNLICQIFKALQCRCVVKVANHSGPEEAILHWSGKLSGQFFEQLCGKRTCTHRHTVCSYCTISLQSMLILGVWGMLLRKFEKIDALHLRAFQGPSQLANQLYIIICSYIDFKKLYIYNAINYNMFELNI